MYYEVKEITSDVNSNIYILVHFWLSVEDRFLDLRPILINDFVMQLTDVDSASFEIKRNIEMFMERAVTNRWTGDRSGSVLVFKTSEPDKYGIVNHPSVRELIQ